MNRVRILIACVTILISYSLGAQSLKEANQWFSIYEYQLAANSYEKISDKSKFSDEDWQKMCYSYFVVQDFEKSYEISADLVKKSKTPAFFYYVNGVSALNIGKNEVAKSALIKYKSKDDEYFVDSLIKTCDVIDTWVPMEYDEVVNSSFNGKRSEMTSMLLEGRLVVLKESGWQNVKGKFSRDSVAIEETDLLFLQPYMYSPNGGRITPINLPIKFEGYNMSSFTTDKDGNVFVTLSYPVSKKAELRNPHIYSAKLVGTDLTDVNPWNYSGAKEGFSTSNATLNNSGTILVYTRLAEDTKNADLYLSKKVNGGWSEPSPIHELNTDGDDMFPLFMDDNTLSFSSDGRVGYGNLDIYTARYDGTKFVNIQHLKSPINGPSDDFNYVLFETEIDSTIFFTSNRRGGNGDDDVYYVTYVKPEEIDSTEIEKQRKLWSDVIIYFDYDSYDIRTDQLEIIYLMRDFLEENEDETIELLVEGHTDVRGTDSYNMKLGMERAEAVTNILVDLGFNKKYINIESKGEKELAVYNANGRYTEKEHQLNRFVIVKLIRKD